MINESLLLQMKSNAVLINTASLAARKLKKRNQFEN